MHAYAMKKSHVKPVPGFILTTEVGTANNVIFTTSLQHLDLNSFSLLFALFGFSFLKIVK